MINISEKHKKKSIIRVMEDHEITRLSNFLKELENEQITSLVQTVFAKKFIETVLYYKNLKTKK